MSKNEDSEVTTVTETTEAPAEPKPVETIEPDKPGDWNPNWRQIMAGGDEKELKQLERLASPVDVWRKARAAEAKISSGTLKPTLSAKATPEEITAYRQAHGIPENPEAYGIESSVDPEMLNIVLKEAHGSNQTPDQVRATLKAWDEIQKSAAEKQAEKDASTRIESEEALRAEWGPEYRRNLNVINGLLDLAGSQDDKAKLLSGRLPDGTLIGNDAGIMRMLAQVALIYNPAGVVVPNGDANPAKGVEDEIARIEKTMRENRKAYNADQKMQDSYLALLDARQKLQARA
jgi:hypothetical protein